MNVKNIPIVEATLGPYKGYKGSAEFSAEDNLFYGKVLQISDLVMYDSVSFDGLKKEFENSVEEYLADCLTAKKQAEKPCTGSVNIRIGPELHLSLKYLADAEGVSLNEYIKKTLLDHVSQEREASLNNGHSILQYDIEPPSLYVDLKEFSS